MPDTKYIAIVDDHTLFRKGLASLIAVFPDYKVLFDASTGKDFIAQLNPKKLPDIVLMDISMPEMDGFATCEWLKQNHPSVKVLALSTMDAETAIIKMIKCGAKGYVLKDADLSELKLAFSELMRVGFYYNDIVSRKVMQSLTQLVDDKSELSAFMNLNENELTFIKLACSEKISSFFSSIIVSSPVLVPRFSSSSVLVLELLRILVVATVYSSYCRTS